MESTKLIDQESREDVFSGQVVIIGARWFLIATGIIMLLWTAVEKEQPAVLLAGVAPLIALMGLNFFLHGRYLLGRPLNPNFVLLTGMLDLAIITLLVLFWPDTAGLDNQFFVFYYVIVLAFAMSMPRRTEVAYTVIAIVLYTAAVLPFLDYTGLVAVQEDVKSLLIRLIALGAMGGLGNFYFRIFRRRRLASIANGVQQ